MKRYATLLLMLVMALGAAAGDFIVEKNVRYSGTSYNDKPHKKDIVRWQELRS